MLVEQHKQALIAQKPINFSGVLVIAKEFAYIVSGHGTDLSPYYSVRFESFEENGEMVLGWKSFISRSGIEIS